MQKKVPILAEPNRYAHEDRQAINHEDQCRAEAVAEAPASLLVPTWFLIGATLFFGVFTSLSVGVADAAARMLLGVGL